MMNNNKKKIPMTELRIMTFDDDKFFFFISTSLIFVCVRENSPFTWLNAVSEMPGHGKCH